MSTTFHHGETEHRLKDGRVMRFRPTGPMHLCSCRSGGGTRRKRASFDAGEQRAGSGRFKPSGKMAVGGGAKEAGRIESYGHGGLSARIFVGLNVENKQAWTLEEVEEAVVTVRAAQGADPSASFILQLGTYSQPGVGLVEEQSVQIILIDTEGTERDKWYRDMEQLGQALRERFLQDSVIVEIQDRGVVQDVFAAKAA